MIFSARAIQKQLLAATVLIAGSASISAKGPKMKPTELVARHLEALGTREARTAAKTRTAEGTGQNKVISGGHGFVSGTAHFVSEGDKLLLSFEFGPGLGAERIAFDGDKVHLNNTTPSERFFLDQFFDPELHSGFGEESKHYFRVPPFRRIISEGLFGGVLSTAWPLLNLGSKRPKLKYRGLKWINGQQLLELEYKPRKGWSNIKGKLYFDPESFHHVASTYEGVITHGTAAVNRLQLEEWFSDFQSSDGLNLPTHWKMTVKVKYLGGYMEGRELLQEEWDVIYKEITHNLSIEPQRFLSP